MIFRGAPGRMYRIVLLGWGLAALVVLSGCVAVPDPPLPSSPVAATDDPEVKLLPLMGAELFPEGIAVDPKKERAYVSSALDGTILVRNMISGEVRALVDPAAASHPMALGLAVDDDRGRVWVAGGRSGMLAVYDSESGMAKMSWNLVDDDAPDVAEVVINDIALAADGAAYVTDSGRTHIYRVPAADGLQAPPELWFDGASSIMPMGAGTSLNGIVVTPDQRYLIVAHTDARQLYRLDLATQHVQPIGLGGSLAADGLALDGHTLYAVSGRELVRIQLDDAYAHGHIDARLADPSFLFPTTTALSGNNVLVVNSQFGALIGGGEPLLPFAVTAIPTQLVDEEARLAREMPAAESLPLQAQVELVPALGGILFDRPVEMAPLAHERLVVAEQDGRIMAFDAIGTHAEMLLDLRQQVSRSGNEEGLLGLAVDPGFVENGFLWVYYSPLGEPRRSRLSRFTVPMRVDEVAESGGTSDELVILEIEQPYANHNGGALRFGSDGMLYIGIGDGGSLREGDSVIGDPQENGQDAGTLLGTILRLDVNASTVGEPYRIPPDNPVIGPGARPEIWAFGLRNPWRMDFDPVSGDLWLGDVGHDQQEEIDRIMPGKNYGWADLEGNLCRLDQGCDERTTAPVAVYGRDAGCSVIGGIVHRGLELAELDGHYLFSDFCSRTIWAIGVDDIAEANVVTLTAADAIATAPLPVTSFGRDSHGVPHVLQFAGPILRLANQSGTQ